MSRVYGVPFAQVPEWLLDADVSDRAVRLFAVLARYSDKDGRAFPGRPVLAERLRCSVDSIDRALTDLATIGAVSTSAHFRSDGSRGANSYYLWPAVAPPGDGIGAGVAHQPPETAAPVRGGSRTGAQGVAAPVPRGSRKVAQAIRNESQRNESQRNEKPPTTVALTSDRSDVERVFDAWVEAKGTRAVLDPKRHRLIDDRLKHFPVEDLVDAVRGWRKSPHHAGENDRATVYNDLALLLRDADHVERFRDLERGAGAVGNGTGPKSKVDQTLANLAAYKARSMKEINA